MYSEKVKHLSRPLIAVLILCLAITMAPLLPMTNSDVHAAGGDTVLTVFDGENELGQFDADDMDALIEGPYNYSTGSGGAYESASNCSGAALDMILSEAGFSIDDLTADHKLRFTAPDKNGVLEDYDFTWADLSADRYFFDAAGVKGDKVPAILKSPNASSNTMRLYIGQLDANDLPKQYWVKDVESITILSPVLTIVNGDDTMALSAIELDDLDQVPNDYSCINSYGEYSTYNGCSGATLNSILAAVGINTANFKSTTKIIFSAPNKNNVLEDYDFTWATLSADRYFFDAAGVKGNKVPVIINSPSASKDDMRLFVGQSSKSDVNNGYFVKSIQKITIIPATPLTVTLNANGGKVATSSIKTYTGDAYGTLASATRKDYKFNGWFTAAKGGSQVNAATVVTDTKDHTIFAQWTGTNKDLKKLKASKGKLTKKFKASKKSYTLKLKKKQASTKITATKAQSVAKVQIKVGKGKWKTAKSVKVKVAKGKSKTVKIKVTAQDKKTKTYTVKVKRAK